MPGAEAGEKLVLPSETIGTAEFGWETCIYDSVGAKVNWTANILISMRRVEQHAEECRSDGKPIPDWLTGLRHFGKFTEYSNRFVTVMKDVFGVDVSLYEDEDGWSSDFGIDHQSNYGETPSNADMLESDERLVDFLCNSDSHIDNNNDNGGWDEVEWATD